MKRLFHFLLMISTVCLAAAETEMIDLDTINPSFNTPMSWYPNKGAAFTPLPTVTYSVEQGRKAMRISNVQGKDGCRFDCYRNYPVLNGDRIILTAEVKGKGKGIFTVQAYSGKKWMGHIGIKDFKVPSEWDRVQVSFDIVDLSEKDMTDGVICMFGAGKGSDFQLRSLKFERVAEIAGNTAFPNIWTAFLPMDADYQPTKQELTSIPAALNGVKPRKVQFAGGEHDFKPDFENKPGPLPHGAGNCAWLFAEINAPQDEDYTIGAGADWWMQVNVNGKAVIDTLKDGNTHHPPRITDHKTTVRLKKGRNLLAVKYVTGAGSSVLALGGPNELRGVGQKIRIVEELFKDDFENAQARRPGNPQIIQGEYSYALVGPSRQGVYTTARKLAFEPARSEYTMPKIASGKSFGMSFRLIRFGKDDARLAFRFSDPKTGKSCVLEFLSRTGGDLEINVLDNGENAGSFRYPAKWIPMDVMFSATALGEYKLALETLVDSSVRNYSGKSTFFADINDAMFRIDAVLETLGGKSAQVLLDDWICGYAMPDQIRKMIPMDIRVEDTFDPKKAGWKLILDEEFDGDSLNPDLWTRTFAMKGIQLKDGFLELRATRKPAGNGKVIYETNGFSTVKKYSYGYYEARVRVRDCSGWITAFWLYGGQTGNSYLDGMEVDVYEDYYVFPGKPLLDFNFHGFVGRVMKSWNYVATLPGSSRDFYTIGCKWTPFEITYYINGKAIRSTANHSPHKTITYDALNHRNGFAPLHLCFYGKITAEYGAGKPIEDKGEFPDVFKIDYVRVWEYPRQEDPVVKWTRREQPLIVESGEKFELEADVTPNPRTNSPIKGVYLFDSGCLIDYKDKPPYKFTVSIDDKYYSGTNYMRTGRSREKPNLQSVLHAYAIYAQDARGRVGHTNAVIKMTRPQKKSTPYQGKAQVIPGRVNPSFYDEGGNGVGYLDDNVNVNGKAGFRKDEGVDTNGEWIGHTITGEWVNLTVDIKKAGKYRVEMDYGAPDTCGGSMLMLLDDEKLLGTFEMPGRGSGWGGLKTGLRNIELPAGRHTLKLIVIGAYNYSWLTFSEEK